MIGGQAAPMPVRMAREPSREEVEARLEALASRVPSRRASDDSQPARGPKRQRDTRETEAETMARLDALEARLNAGGPRP